MSVCPECARPATGTVGNGRGLMAYCEPCKVTWLSAAIVTPNWPIDSAAAVSTIVETPPKTEWAIRPLVKLLNQSGEDAEIGFADFRRVHAGGFKVEVPPTADYVARVRDAYTAAGGDLAELGS